MLDACSKIYKVFSQTEEEEAEAEEEGEAGQEHVYAFYEKLSEEEQRELDDDYDLLQKEYGDSMERVDDAFVSGKELEDANQKGAIVVEPPKSMNWELKKPPNTEPGANLSRIADVSQKKLHSWRQNGFELFYKGRVAIVVLAGGLDARVGENLPKGLMDIGLLSQKSIFQLYCERIRRLQHLVHRKFKRMSYVPMYIMCNTNNFETIEDFFRDNAYFGLREQDVMFFKQNYHPAVDFKGKFILSEKSKICQYPSGNGAMIRALAEEGMVSDMKSRSVSCLYVCSTDNVLTKVGDPLFVGYCDTCKAECGLKCIEKLVPEEKFGVFCSKREKVHEDVDGDGRLDAIDKLKAAVFEHFEISDDQKKRRDKANSASLELNAGNLSQYFFKVDFVMRIHSKMKTWHLIMKHIPYIDLWSGEKVLPVEKNAYKLETWVFDAFEHSQKVVGLQVPREELALVKQLEGPDSPQTALQAVGRLHQAWILQAGGTFFENKVASETEDAKCEISPLVSYEGEDLSGQFLAAIYLPYYLPSQQEIAEASRVKPPLARRASIHYLNQEDDLAARELEMELQGRLGKTMDKIQTGDKEQQEYQGERAEKDEVLPPTPRMVDNGAFFDDLRTSPRGASARMAGQISNRNDMGSGKRASAQAVAETEATNKPQLTDKQDDGK